MAKRVREEGTDSLVALILKRGLTWALGGAGNDAVLGRSLAAAWHSQPRLPGINYLLPAWRGIATILAPLVHQVIPLPHSSHLIHLRSMLARC